MVFCIQCLTPGILVYREGRISSLHCPLVLSTPLSSQTPDSVMHIKALPSSPYNKIFIHIKALPSSPTKLQYNNYTLKVNFSIVCQYKL